MVHSKVSVHFSEWRSTTGETGKNNKMTIQTLLSSPLKVIEYHDHESQGHESSKTQLNQREAFMIDSKRVLLRSYCYDYIVQQKMEVL